VSRIPLSVLFLFFFFLFGFERMAYKGNRGKRWKGEGERVGGSDRERSERANSPSPAAAREASNEADSDLGDAGGEAGRAPDGCVDATTTVVLSAR
jgi:hypothetical protein